MKQISVISKMMDFAKFYSLRSLMYINYKNRGGPRTEPCGTPYKTEARLDS